MTSFKGYANLLKSMFKNECTDSMLSLSFSMSLVAFVAGTPFRVRKKSGGGGAFCTLEKERLPQRLHHQHIL